MSIKNDVSVDTLDVKLNGFKTLIDSKFTNVETVLEERDNRYNDRFKAQEVAVINALAAQKELTNNAFMSSEKAIVKAENAQTAYNQFHNDLTRKMEAKDREYIDIRRFEDFKKDYENYKIAQATEVTSLRISRGENVGKSTGLNTGWVILGQAISIIGAIIAIFIAMNK
ncbi:MAG: hypothetical protein Q7R95_06130 [bacterium]|nr:hypothetical protein [bacterium]